jgi:Synergist-CTERM protein sorting domain-containing protein
MRWERFARRSEAACLHTTFVIAALAVAGCVDPPEYGETSSAISVNTAAASTCSTGTVRGLAAQIAREVDCMAPSSLVKFKPTTKIKFTSSAVLPYIHGSAKRDLDLVAANHPLRVNSGYRTLPQQYLVYRWWRAGRCGIAKAALPGTSNHESGRAVDLANWSTRIGAMASHHWSHDVPGDPVHFDHLTSPDNRGKDVRAFQRLWNRNHPGDKIAVDGDYGPQTADRLKRSPAKGFAKGAQCASSLVAPEPGEVDVVAVDAPDLVASAARVHVIASVANGSDVVWPATARLVTADGAASALYDAQTWTSPSEIGPIGSDVAAHGDIDLDIDIATPQVIEETPLELALAVVDGNTQIGTFELAFTISPGDTSISVEGDDEMDDTPADEDGVVEDGGGCNTGGSAGWLIFAAVIPLARRRRRQGLQL